MSAEIWYIYRVRLGVLGMRRPALVHVPSIDSRLRSRYHSAGWLVDVFEASNKPALGLLCS